MTCKINADTTNGLKLTSDTSGEIDLQIDASTKVHMASDGKLGIGTTSPSSKLTVQDFGNDAALYCGGGLKMDDGPGNPWYLGKGILGSTGSEFLIGNGSNELLRINQGGDVLVGTTDGSPWNNTSAAGVAINAVSGGAGLIAAARANGDPFAANRTGSDGHLMAWYRDGSFVGQIEVSSGTVTYAAFTGTHPSRLSDNSKPDLLRGTVIETIDTMCDWYELVFKTSDNIDKITEITLPEGKSVGDSYTMEYMGETVTGTIRKKQNHKHTMCKVSDTEDSAMVYGIFSHWHTESPYNELMVNAVGTSVVRVASGVTVSAGDLLSSKGDGTAKLQGDDIIRTKTIGKVLSNVKQETYSDGSYTVPCALYCG